MFAIDFKLKKNRMELLKASAFRTVKWAEICKDLYLWKFLCEGQSFVTCIYYGQFNDWRLYCLVGNSRPMIWDGEEQFRFLGKPTGESGCQCGT